MGNDCTDELCSGCDQKLVKGDIFKCPECEERFCSDCMEGNTCYDCHRKAVQGTTYGLRDLGMDDDKDEDEKK